MKKQNLSLGVAGDKIEKRVVLTSDPLTCTYVAEKYMRNYEKFNDLRNFSGYTGTYFDKPLTVISAGIGMGQMGILAEELFERYGVESVVYIGPCDGVSPAVQPKDFVLVTEAETDSNYPELLGLCGKVTESEEGLTQAVFDDFVRRDSLPITRKNGAKLHRGKVFSSDRRISGLTEAEALENQGILAVDTATAALFAQAKKWGKSATAFLLVDRNIPNGEEIPDEEHRYRPAQNSMMKQIVLALANV